MVNVDWQTVAHGLAEPKSNIASTVSREKLIYRANRNANDVVRLRKECFTSLDTPEADFQKFAKGLSGIFRLQTRSGR